MAGMWSRSGSAKLPGLGKFSSFKMVTPRDRNAEAWATAEKIADLIAPGFKTTTPLPTPPQPESQPVTRKFGAAGPLPGWLLAFKKL
jgi:hypothetical protein